jgi:hypothetical protein
MPPRRVGLYRRRLAVPPSSRPTHPPRCIVTSQRGLGRNGTRVPCPSTPARALLLDVRRSKGRGKLCFISLCRFSEKAFRQCLVAESPCKASSENIRRACLGPRHFIIRAGQLEQSCLCFRIKGSNGWLLLLRARFDGCDHASMAELPPRTQRVRIRSGTSHRQPSTGAPRSAMLTTWRGVLVSGLLLRSCSAHRG